MTDFKGNPNRMIFETQKMLGELGEKLKDAMPLMKGMEKDKEYRFTYNGKKGTMLVLKSKVISLEIEGVNDEEIRDILNRLNDRPD